jgi:putative sterol carrier protein
MRDRAKPPDDISPKEFFTVWLPARVAEDHERRGRLGDTAAALVFDLLGEQGGVFTVRIANSVLVGSEGRDPEADLELRVDVETWRALNRGEISAPEALLRRRLHLSGKLLLALKLHLILG